MADEPIPKYNIVHVYQALGGVVPKGGTVIKVRCLFHEDRTPSATLNTDTQRIRCYSCGFFDDAIGLIQAHDGLDFADAKSKAESCSQGASRTVQRQPGAWLGLLD